MSATGGRCGFLLLSGFGAGFGPNAASLPAPGPPAARGVALDLGESESASLAAGPSGRSFHPGSGPWRCRRALQGPGGDPAATPPCLPAALPTRPPRPFQRGPALVCRINI